MRNSPRNKYLKEMKVSRSEYLFAQIADKFNAEDLAFSMNRPQSSIFMNESVIPNYGYLNVFRPHILELIYRNRMDAYFVIYSLAEALAVYHHVILIEMYYNLVYRLHPDRNEKSEKYRIGDFKFFRVISALWTVTEGSVPSKSLSTVRTVVGPIEYLDDIYIVDDMAFNAWTEPIVEPMITAPTRIYALQPSPFQVVLETKSWEAVISVSQKHQSVDTYFQDLMNLVEVSKLVPASYRDERLLWTDHAGLKDIVRFAREFEQRLHLNEPEIDVKPQTELSNGKCCDCIIG